MARLKNCFFGKLISAVSQYDKKPYEDWRADYTGQEGLILLFQSMHSAPGKIFFYMMIREGKWMHSSLGEWKPGEVTDILYTRHSIYTFSRQHHLSKDEKMGPAGKYRSCRDNFQRKNETGNETIIKAPKGDIP